MEILDITALDYSVVGVRVCEAKHTGTIRKYMEIRESHRRDQRPAGAIATHYRQLLHCTVTPVSRKNYAAPPKSQTIL